MAALNVDLGPLPQDVPGIAEFGRRNRNVDLAGRFVYNDDDEPVIRAPSSVLLCAALAHV